MAGRCCFYDLCIQYVGTDTNCALAALAPSILVTSVQAEIGFLPGNFKHFPYTVILPFPTDISLGSEFLPVSVFGLGWGWVRSEGLKEAEPAPVDKIFTSFLCLQAVEIEDRRIQSCVHFMTLKKLNRLAHIRLKKGRDQTHEVEIERFNPPRPSSPHSLLNPLYLLSEFASSLICPTHF